MLQKTAKSMVLGIAGQMVGQMNAWLLTDRHIVSHLSRWQCVWKSTHWFLQHILLFCCRTVFVTAALTMASRTYPVQAAVWLITLFCPMTVELLSSYEITSRIQSSHLQVSVYARANRNACEAVNRKGNAEYSEKVIGTAKKCTSLVFVISVPTSYSRRIQSCF